MMSLKMIKVFPVWLLMVGMLLITWIPAFAGEDDTGDHDSGNPFCRCSML